MDNIKKEKLRIKIEKLMKKSMKEQQRLLNSIGELIFELIKEDTLNAKEVQNG